MKYDELNDDQADFFDLIQKILIDNPGTVEHAHIAFVKTNKYYEITYGKMYESPSDLTLSKLIELSKLFGTEKIDVDNYSQGGCEYCDYGSDYGHSLQIYNATNNINELDMMCQIKETIEVRHEDKW